MIQDKLGENFEETTDCSVIELKDNLFTISCEDLYVEDNTQ